MPPPASIATIQPRALHRQTRLLLLIGFGGLLLLMAVFGLSAISFLYQIEVRQERIREDYIERDRILEKLRSSIYLSGTYARDFLLDADGSLASAHRRQFAQAEQDVRADVEAYRRLLRPHEEDAFRELDLELTDFFQALGPAMTWTPDERRSRRDRFIEQQVLPRRAAAIALDDRIQALSEKQLEAGSQAVTETFASFRVKLVLLLLLTAAIGIVLAGLTMWRLLQLEHNSALSFEEVLRTRGELKKLSAELVSAQESERRRISRELHDEVGQVLSATMLAIGNLRSSLKESNSVEASRQLRMIEEMTQRNVRVVRNISLLLRPALLDDIGLIPALKWLAREVSRTEHIPVEVLAENFPEDLPEEHRTCVYRVVQEAIRNACRHAAAHRVQVIAQEKGGRLFVSVCDDGKGFDPNAETGMGLMGIEERVVTLNGNLKIDSGTGRGTVVSVELPLLGIAHPVPQN